MRSICFSLFFLFTIPSILGMQWRDKIIFLSRPKRTQKQFLENIIRNINDAIEAKIDLNAPIKDDSHGKRPLHMAAYDDSSGVLIHHLLKAGALPDVHLRNGTTPLHIATHYTIFDSTTNMTDLLKHNANPNIRDNTKNTPLHILCMHYPLERSPQVKISTKLLLAYGANPFATNKHSKTPLDMISKNRSDLKNLIFRIYNHKKAAYLLLLKGKDTANSPSFGRLPTDLIKLILDQMYPRWPLPNLEHSELLSYLQKKA